MRIPSDVRKSTNAVYSFSGSSFSATVLTGEMCWEHQAPAWSQLPMCGRAAMTPRPEANGSDSRSGWRISNVSMRAPSQPGRRKASHQ